VKTVAFYTLGCKVNQYETEAMSELFQKAGYTEVEAEEVADVYVINTCTVTSLSDKKSRQFIRRSRRNNENAIIAVVGCYSQISPDEVKKIEGVNLILGTNERKLIVEFVEDLASFEQVVKVEDIMSVSEFEELEIENVKGRTRAFLKIQEGCNQYCTYCIIPYARGKIRSRKLENIQKEAQRLSGNGFKEIVLTGIHVASYGKDLENATLLDAIKLVHEIDGIERIRLSSVEPRLMSDEFLNGIAALPKVCHHFHMSLQSGCDTILKKMNRKYTTEEYFDIVQKIKTVLPNSALTTDVIVGFPQETDEEFQTTLEFVEKVGFSKVHVFKYSPREGTPAAKMEGQVHPDKKSERSQKLIALAEKLEKDFLNQFVGKEMNVIFETDFAKGTGQIEGFTDNYIKVVADGSNELFGNMKKVKIISSENEILLGKITELGL